MPRRIPLDKVVDGSNLPSVPHEVSGQDRFDNVPKTRYVAKYRMNTGYWEMERVFHCHTDEEAKLAARAVLPKRKVSDKTWMYVSSIYADVPDTNSQSTAPEETP